MTNTVPGFSSPAAGFEQPLDMLSACHERVAAQLSTLRRLVPHLAVHGADTPAREAALAVMRYFDVAAPHHHSDEEVDLFPALIESMAGSDAVCLRQLTEGLSAEHRELEALWQSLRAQLALVAEGRVPTRADEAVRPFIERYEAHIAREDQELLPMAGRLLSDDTMARIGEAMEQRRREAPRGISG